MAEMEVCRSVAGRVGRQRGLGPGPCLTEEEFYPSPPPNNEIVMMVRALNFWCYAFSIIETHTLFLAYHNTHKALEKAAFLIKRPCFPKAGI